MNFSSIGAARIDERLAPDSVSGRVIRQQCGEGIQNDATSWRHFQIRWCFSLLSFSCEGEAFSPQTSARQTLHPEYRQSGTGNVCCHCDVRHESRKNRSTTRSRTRERCATQILVGSRTSTRRTRDGSSSSRRKTAQRTCSRRR